MKIPFIDKPRPPSKIPPMLARDVKKRAVTFPKKKYRNLDVTDVDIHQWLKERKYLKMNVCYAYMCGMNGFILFYIQCRIICSIYTYLEKHADTYLLIFVVLTPQIS